MSQFQTLLADFEKVLNSEVIDVKSVRKLSSGGCPQERCIRSLCWKVLLGFLPRKRSEWAASLEKHRKSYSEYIDEMILAPSRNQEAGDVTFDDHPLNPNPKSEWSTYFKDNETLTQIDRDCRRLYPDLAFFQQATEFPCEVLKRGDFETLRRRVQTSALYSETLSSNWLGISNLRRRGKAEVDHHPLSHTEEAHWEVCTRILFIYSKLNPGQGYVQGMNEILGPIYYVFASERQRCVRQHAEADAFFCFTSLMGEIRDNFIKTLDDSKYGIGVQMQTFLDTLKRIDYAVWHRLHSQEIKPQFYSFRWITLLLSQEFTLPDVLRLWDSLLASDQKLVFLSYTCCAMLVLIRDQLLRNDFSDNMKLVQNYPPSDVALILSKAVELCQMDRNIGT